MAKLRGPTETQQKRIREKLADGTLPRDLAGAVPMMTGSLRVASCDACDQVGMIRPIAGRLWHEACFIFWQAETAR